MKYALAAMLGCALSLIACERASPHHEPHEGMMPPGAPPMPHADGAMAHAMQLTVPPLDAASTEH